MLMLKVLLISAHQPFVGKDEEEKATLQTNIVKVVAKYGNRLNDSIA